MVVGPLSTSNPKLWSYTLLITVRPVELDPFAVVSFASPGSPSQDTTWLWIIETWKWALADSTGTQTPSKEPLVWNVWNWISNPQIQNPKAVQSLRKFTFCFLKTIFLTIPEFSEIRFLLPAPIISLHTTPEIISFWNLDFLCFSVNRIFQIFSIFLLDICSIPKLSTLT